MRSLLRSVTRAPGLFAATVITIALGVGALTTISMSADATLMRDPPFPDARNLAVLFTTFRSEAEPRHLTRWSYPRIRRLRSQIRTVPKIANFSRASVTVTGAGHAEALEGEVVSPEYFDILGVAPALGSGFPADADRAAGASPLAVIGDRLWRRRFGADSGTIGKTVEINHQLLTIIGVMPPGFRGLSDRAEIWFPTVMAPLITYGEYLTTNQSFISLVARLRAPDDLNALRRELAQLAPGLARELPSDDDQPGATVGATAQTLNDARIPPDLRRSITLLLAGVVVLFLLAVVNATSLRLGRAITLRREAAIRTSLGGRERTLLGHYFVRAAVPTAVGALGALVIAWAAGGLVVPMNAWAARNYYGTLASFSEPAFGWRTVACWALVTLVALAIGAGGPALATVRGDLGRELRDGSRGARSGGLALRRPSIPAVIVVVEALLAVLLLAVGGLMIGSFARIRGTSLGVEPDHVLTFVLRASEVEVPPEQAPAFIDRALAAIHGVAGVRSASVDGGAPLAGSAINSLHVASRPEPGPGQAPEVLRHYVGPEHFETLGIPLKRGRTFTDRDRAGQPGVTIVSETAARRFWPGQNPIGQRVWFEGSGFDSPATAAEIVGIVGDVQYRPLDREPNLSSFYTPYRQFSYSRRTYFVRTEGDPTALVSALRAALHAVAPNVPMTEVGPLTDVIGASWSRNRFDAWFFGSFALLALALAGTGIYAVVAYAVQQRRREMAIRLAVGASPSAVFALVVREGMAFPLLGLAIGVVLSLAAGRFLRGIVYGIAPDDLRVLVGAAVGLAGVALAACGLPARRAMAVEPQQVLRAE